MVIRFSKNSTVLQGIKPMAYDLAALGLTGHSATAIHTFSLDNN